MEIYGYSGELCLFNPILFHGGSNMTVCQTRYYLEGFKTMKLSFTIFLRMNKYVTLYAEMLTNRYFAIIKFSIL